MDARRLVVFALAIAIKAFAQIPGGNFTGAPFSATQITERTQTLADGTHITQPGQKVVMYRDSAGRTRNEFTFPAPPRSDQPGDTRVTIYDSVAGFRYQLDPKGKIAQRFAMQVPRPAIAQPQAAPPRPGAAPSAVTALYPSAEFLSAPNGGSSGSAAPGNPPVKATSEPLGSQLIEGLTTEGTRTITTWAVGSVGNDRDIVATNEAWYSKQLRIFVLRKISDPRSGDTTIKLADISLVEPNPALFIPPTDYLIKDTTLPTISQ